MVRRPAWVGLQSTSTYITALSLSRALGSRVQNCNVLQVAHVTPDVAFLQQKDGMLAQDWATAQVATTADFAHGSFFWTHFSGGLNYQVSLLPSCTAGIYIGLEALACKACL